MLNLKQRGAISVLRSSLLPALAALPLCFAAACGVDTTDDSVESTAQGLTGSCAVQRPYGWTNGINTCVESQRNTTTLHLAPGGTFTFFSIPVVGLGTGSVTIECHSNGDGLWDEIELSCVPGRGGGGGF